MADLSKLKKGLRRFVAEAERRRPRRRPRSLLFIEPQGEMAHDAYLQGLDQMLEEDLTPWND